MESWAVVIVAIALVVQVAILIALFLQTRRTAQQVEKTISDLNNKVSPILTRVQILLDDTQPKISTMVSDAAHIVYLARGQAQKVDRVFTGTLEAVEEAGSQFKHSVWQPFRKASALVQGIKVGLDLLRSRRGKSSHGEEPLEQEEELFI